MTLATFINAAVINIPTQVGPLNWARCFRKTLARPGVEVIGVNEVFTKKAKKLFIQMARRAGWGRAGVKGSPNPIFFDKKVFEKVSVEVVTLHGPLSQRGRWPGFNGARYATVVVLRRRATGREETYVCTHLVPEGRKVTVRDRRRSRKASKAKLAELGRASLAAGRSFTLMGDMNWGKAFKLRIPGFKWIRPKGIDKIGIAPAPDQKLGKHKFISYPAPTDHHHGIQATAALT